jgi:hypothetical protein
MRLKAIFGSEPLPPSKAFVSAVGVLSAVVLAVCLFTIAIAGSQRSDWLELLPAFAIVIGVPGLLLLPMLYLAFRRRGQPRAVPSPRKRFSLAIGFIVAGLIQLFTLSAQARTLLSMLLYTALAGYFIVAGCIELYRLRLSQRSKEP